MNRQPDKFFREKLHNYERALSPGVWKRVSANANNKGFLWLKVAAAISLLMVAGILIFESETKEEPPVIAEKAISDSNASHQAEENTAARSDTFSAAVPSLTAEADKTGRPIKKKRSTSREGNTSAGKEPIDQRQQVMPAIEQTRQETVAEIPDIENSYPSPRSVAALDTPRRKTVTIVFNAEEVNEKYLTKKHVAEATPDEKETSTWKRLLDKAADLKHNQDPLGDLRQKKNEILALNFKSDKKRSKN